MKVVKLLLVAVLMLALSGTKAPLRADGGDASPTTPLQEGAGKRGKNLTADRDEELKDLAKRVGIDQKMDAQLPLNLEFKNESGQTVKLGDYFGKRPVLLNMIQYTCDMVCSAQFEAMNASLNELKFDAGKEFDIVSVSLDPRETPLIATDVKEERLKQYKRPTAAAGWHFLTGSEKNIKALASTIGFKYIWDERSQQYVHPDGLILMTPDGHVSKYYLQLDYNPRDLRFGIIEASHEKIGTVVDRIALSCFHYDPLKGKYSLQIMSFLRLASVAFVLGGLSVIAFWVIKEKIAPASGSALGGGTRLKKA